MRLLRTTVLGGLLQGELPWEGDSGWLKTQGMFSGAALRRHCQHMFGCGVEVGERAGTQQPVKVLDQARDNGLW